MKRSPIEQAEHDSEFEASLHSPDALRRILDAKDRQIKAARYDAEISAKYGLIGFLLFAVCAMAWIAEALF